MQYTSIPSTQLWKSSWDCSIFQCNFKHFPCWVVYCTRNAKSVVACPCNRLVCPNWTSRAGGLVGGSHFFAVCAASTLFAGQQGRCSLCGTPGSSRTVCTSQRCSCTFSRTPFPGGAKLAHLRSLCASLHAPCALGTKLTCSRIWGANLLIEATHRAGNTHCLRVQVTCRLSVYRIILCIMKNYLWSYSLINRT